MNYIYGAILGLIRGLGTFLPISDTGHLLIAERIFHFPKELLQNQGLDIILSLATLLAVLILFYKTVWGMIMGLFSMIGGLFQGTFKWRKASRHQMMAVYVLVATLPYIAVTWAGEHFGVAARWGSNLLLAGIMLLVTAALILLGNISYCHNWTVQEMKPGHAFKLGLFQAVSLIPGLSRSGTTLAMGMNMGFERNAALEFTFMLTLPALIVSNVFKVSGLATVNAADAGIFAVAALAAVLAAIAAILLMKWLVKKDRLGVFVYYCALAGIAAIVLNFVV